MKLITIESPFKSNTNFSQEVHLEYLMRAIHRTARHGAPFASHGFYPHFYDDKDKFERARGMMFGWEILGRSDQVFVFCDYGISDGMKQGIEMARTVIPEQFGKILSIRYCFIGRNNNPAEKDNLGITFHSECPTEEEIEERSNAK